jgi:hypothetical protein
LKIQSLELTPITKIYQRNLHMDENLQEQIDRAQIKAEVQTARSVDTGAKNLQEGCILLLIGAVRYYYRALVKGPMGARIGVLFSFVVGFLLASTAPAARSSAMFGSDNQLIGTLIFLFGGLITGRIGAFIQRQFFARRQQ